MRAQDHGISAQIRARDALKKLFRFQPPPSTRLILAGTEPRLLGESARKWNEVEPLLNEWKCRAPNDSVEAAIALAREVGKSRANILVLTDHAPAEKKIANERLQWRAFGMPLANAAIVNASRTANGDQDRCLLEIANFSKTPEIARVLVQTGSNTVKETELSLAPSEQQRLVFNIAASAPLLKAILESDALPDDNQIQLLPPIRKRVRVQVALTNSALAELVNRTLAATGLRAAISENPELVIHQTDAAPNGNAWSLRWKITEKADAFTGPFIVDSSHPVGQGVSLEGAIWAAAEMTNSPEEIPIILAGNVPLVSTREDAVGREFLTLNLNPDLSTIQKTPDWPILFWNILEWRAAQKPGLKESNARLGTEVMVKTTGEPVTVRFPDGAEKSFARTGDQLALETPMPGMYSVAMGQATNSFAVNSLAAEESNLQACQTGQWGTWRADADRRFEQSPMAWIFALAALGLLTAHLWFLSGGKGNV
jgi:hypothetical protein